jgi:hypothetical protein
VGSAVTAGAPMRPRQPAAGMVRVGWCMVRVACCLFVAWCVLHVSWFMLHVAWRVRLVRAAPIRPQRAERPCVRLFPQASVAKCLAPLMAGIKPEGPRLMASMMNQLLTSESYAQRRQTPTLAKPPKAYAERRPGCAGRCFVCSFVVCVFVLCWFGRFFCLPLFCLLGCWLRPVAFTPHRALDRPLAAVRRRGAAFGVAGIVKGLGIASLKQLEVMTTLQTAAADSKAELARQARERPKAGARAPTRGPRGGRALASRSPRPIRRRAHIGCRHGPRSLFAAVASGCGAALRCVCVRVTPTGAGTGPPVRRGVCRARCLRSSGCPRRSEGARNASCCNGGVLQRQRVATCGMLQHLATCCNIYVSISACVCVSICGCRLFEPYVIHILPLLLSSLGDNSVGVREAAE